MNSVAELKRRMVTGRTVTVVNHLYAHLTGERVILKAQANSWCLEFPEGHPKHGTGGSWLNVPKAADCVFDGNTVTINDEGKPFVMITVS